MVLSLLPFGVVGFKDSAIHEETPAKYGKFLWHFRAHPPGIPSAQAARGSVRFWGVLGADSPGDPPDGPP